MIRLGDLLSDILPELGFIYSVTDAGVVTTSMTTQQSQRVLRIVNNVYQDIACQIPKNFLMKKRIISLPAKYSTGLISITSGTNTVTGSGTSFSYKMQGRQLAVESERRIYFIRSFVSTTELTLEEAHPIGCTDSSYTIAQWAIPLPFDFIPPLHKDALYDVTNKNKLVLVEPDMFWHMYNTTYKTGRITHYCVDGMSRFPILDYGTVSVTNGSETITMGSGNIISKEDIGRYISIEGDSIPYKIVGVPSSTTITVSPAVQRSTGSSLSYAVDRHPLPLIWFNYAPSNQTVLQLSYKAMRQSLWTPNQVVDLNGDYERLFMALVRYRLIAMFSSDAQHKADAYLQLKEVASLMPKDLDTSDILRDFPIETTDSPNFPNVIEGEDV